METLDYPPKLVDTDNHGPLYVSLSSRNLRDFANNIIEELTSQGHLIIYVGVTKPSAKIKSMLEDRDIDTQKILFLDMATKIAGSAPDRAQNTMFFKPEEINQVNMKLDDAVDSIPDGYDAVLLFDTISTLSIYNDEETILQFLKNLSAKTHEWKLPAIFMGVDAETDEKLQAMIEKTANNSFDFTE